MNLQESTWEDLCALAEREVVRLTAGLPRPLRERAESVPVLLEPQPSEEMQETGIEADTLGLFMGSEWAEAGADPLPPQIILYLENLLELAEMDEQRFRDEIRTTFLHELGHFLGLDEAGLEARGLE
jgi:predicted Zn-dependent protease with MMP-like domain